MKPCLFFILPLFLLSACTSRTDDNLPHLRVYTYNSFQVGYGPGPEIVKAFEKDCSCKVDLINVGDAGLMVQRLKLEPEAQIDLVIGLDQLTMGLAMKERKWKALDLSKVEWIEGLPEYNYESFVPFDWAPLTFIYREGDVEPPTTWKDLVSSHLKGKISVQDPRMSTPGLQFLYWVATLEGEDGTLKYLQKFKNNVYRVSPSWSSSYGLFQKGKAKVVFSYVTSPVFHWDTQKDRSFKPFQIAEGHPVQVELMGVPANCNQCELAEKLALFILQKANQKLVMSKNYMLPVVKGVVEGTEFEKLPKLKLIDLKNFNEFSENQKNWIDIWYKSIGG